MADDVYEEGTPEYNKAVAAREARWKANGVNDSGAQSQKTSNREIDHVIENTEKYEKTGHNQYETDEKSPSIDEVLENTDKYTKSGRNQYDKRDVADRMYDDLKKRVKDFNESRRAKHDANLKKMEESDKKLEQELRIREKHKNLGKRKARLDRGSGLGGLSVGTPKGGGTGLSFAGGMGPLNLGSPGGMGVGLSGLGLNGKGSGFGLNLGMTKPNKESKKKSKKPSKKKDDGEIIIHIKK